MIFCRMALFLQTNPDQISNLIWHNILQKKFLTKNEMLF